METQVKGKPNGAEIVPAGVPMVSLTPLDLLRMALEQGSDVDKLKQLLELQERWEGTQARKAFEVAFAGFKTEAPKLERTKEVSFGANANRATAYKYTPLDQIANAVGPLLAKHGLSYNWRQESTKESITVTCILRHTQGHAIENTLIASADPSGSKNAIQAIGSAVSYLRRYTLLGVLGMATGDEDNDGVTNGEAADFIAHIQDSNNLQELEFRYKEALKAALNAKSPKAVGLYMQAREKREKELRA